MIADFRKGRLPYYEVDLNTGNIYQKFTDGEVMIISDPEKSLNNFIKKNVEILEKLIEDIEKQTRKKTRWYNSSNQFVSCRKI